MNRVIEQLRAALLRDAVDLTEGQLLEYYLSRRDEAAFEALVRRHGPMVFGVCRRILRHRQDSEHAFQATFLVLARKAASVVPAEMSSDQTLAVPASVAKRIPVGQQLRVLVLIAEDDLDREWEQLAAMEFGQGYADSDASYDQLSSR